MLLDNSVAPKPHELMTCNYLKEFQEILMVAIAERKSKTHKRIHQYFTLPTFFGLPLPILASSNELGIVYNVFLLGHQYKVKLYIFVCSPLLPLTPA